MVPATKVAFPAPGFPAIMVFQSHDEGPGSMSKRLGLAVVAATLLTAGSAVATEDRDQAAMAAAGEVVFHRCLSCHSLDPAENTFGPSLYGVVGREVGTQPRFAYSAGMQAADFVWTEEKLRAWVADNTAVLPTTRMRHVSITDPAEQDYLIAFLKTLK